VLSAAGVVALSLIGVTLSLSRASCTARSGEQQRLYFLPLPHGHGAFAETFRVERRIVRGARHQS
jgi:hypothetical protein